MDLDIRPLTIVAGQNSAGKSSAIQPLLLLKQTVEATHDPGPLLLDGSCVKASRSEDLFWRGANRKKDHATEWSVEIELSATQAQDRPARINTTFAHRNGRLILQETSLQENGWDEPSVFRDDLTDEQLAALARRAGLGRVLDSQPEMRPTVLVARGAFGLGIERVGLFGPQTQLLVNPFPADVVADVIHLPGLRGNPERSYPITGVSGRYPGTFHPYTASVILHWSEENSSELHGIGEDLGRLGLTWKVDPARVDDTRVELRVGRLPRPRQGGAQDLVNIADVGFGTSQVLPVIVALHAARPGQLVHIEQPEIHLHPNAQVEMAKLLVATAKRGVRLFVETHSSLMLKTIQIEVAEGRLPPDDVALHWFTRSPEGATRVTSGGLDSSGAFGSWPVDFSSVEMEIEEKFINAAFPRAGA